MLKSKIKYRKRNVLESESLDRGNKNWVNCVSQTKF